MKFSWTEPHERNYNFKMNEAEFVLPSSEGTAMEVEPEIVNHIPEEVPDFMILQEGDTIPAGYYIPRESTVKLF